MIDALKLCIESKDLTIKFQQLQIENLLLLVKSYQAKAEATAPNYQVTDYQECENETTVLKEFKKPLHLVCKDPGDYETTGLEFLERYVATGLANYRGFECYLVVMPDGSKDPKKVSRFVVCKKQSKVRQR